MSGIMSFFPTIGKVVGSLLTQLCDQPNEAPYLEFDVSPDGPGDKNYKLYFTNEGGRILATNSSPVSGKPITLSFPENILENAGAAEVEEEIIKVNPMATVDVTEAFQRHAVNNDSVVEITPVVSNSALGQTAANGQGQRLPFSAGRFMTNGSVFQIGCFRVTGANDGSSVMISSGNGANITVLALLIEDPMSPTRPVATVSFMTNGGTPLAAPCTWLLNPALQTGHSYILKLTYLDAQNNALDQMGVPVSQATLRIIAEGKRVN